MATVYVEFSVATPSTPTVGAPSRQAAMTDELNQSDPAAVVTPTYLPSGVGLTEKGSLSNLKCWSLNRPPRLTREHPPFAKASTHQNTPKSHGRASPLAVHFHFLSRAHFWLGRHGGRFELKSFIEALRNVITFPGYVFSCFLGSQSSISIAF